MLPLLLTLQAGAAEVVVFGDSWAEQSGAILGEVLREKGYPYRVSNHGVGGTTAAAWNQISPNALVDAVTANPDARWVWLSILGNDFLANHLLGQGPNAATLHEAELAEMLDRLFAAHPDVEVVSFGYDWLNFEQSGECRNQAYLTFAAYATFEMVLLEVVPTPTINAALVRDVADVQDRVAASRPGFHVRRLYGTLQADAGGVVSDLLPSPASRMDDCIHPTDRGYRVLHRALVDGFWGLPAPTARILGTGPVCRGDALALSAAATPHETLAWTVDGASAGAAATLDLTPTDEVEVRLTVRNGAWKDADTATVPVVEPPVAALDGPDALAAGSPGTWTVHVDGGLPDAAVTWTVDGVPAPKTGPTLTVTFDADGTHTVAASVDGGPCAAAEVARVVEVTGSADTDALADETDDTDDAVDTDAPVDTDGSPLPAVGPACGCEQPGGAPASFVAAALLAFGARRRRDGGGGGAAHWT